MIRSKCLAKKFKDGVTIDGVLMKPDWRGTFMGMGINDEIKLSRQMTTISRVRTCVSTINKNTGRKYVVSSEELDERFTVRREA